MSGKAEIVNLAAVVREARDKGVPGDDVACELGEDRLGACLWRYGFLPGLVTNALCAFLHELLVREAFAHKSIDGDVAAFFATSIALPLFLSVLALAICLGKAVRAAGSRGYWRAILGYGIAAGGVGLVMLVRSLVADAHLRVILYMN